MLKACPFCGASVARICEWPSYLTEPEIGPKMSYYILCQSCGVRTTSAETKEKAASLWNRRAKRTIFQKGVNT